MIPNDLFDALCCTARMVVATTWHRAHRSPNAVPDEVAHIYELTTTGVRLLGDLWEPILSSRGISLKVTGVFAHQTPKASYDHPQSGAKSPELADLVIVHDHTAPDLAGVPVVTRRAVLVQTKMANHGVPGQIDDVQEYLYQHWPDFELKGLGANRKERLLSGLRNIRPNTGGSRYGLIDKTAYGSLSTKIYPFCWDVPWTFSDPLDPIRSAGGEDAGAFIANMLFDSRWARGRSCHAVATPLALTVTPNNHFDVTIQELLDLTAEKVLKSKIHPHMGGKRGVSVVCWTPSSSHLAASFAQRMEKPGGGGDDENPSRGDDREAEVGPRILRIETSQTD